jgi:hypothetical protein
MDILERLKDLQVQAARERSHHYVKATAEAAILEIERLRKTESRLMAASPDRCGSYDLFKDSGARVERPVMGHQLSDENEITRPARVRHRNGDG